MTWTLPRLIAHRGGALLAPENTLPAFAEAARRGYRAIECDVALTRDGVPVLLHDRTLKRTAGLDRPVQEVDLATVQTLEAGAWFHPRFSGTRVPTLEQAIACWLGHGQQALIELKIAPGCDPVPVARASAAVVGRCWRGEPPMFISFNGAALAATAAAAPQARRALLLGEWTEDWRQRMREACADALDIEHGLATRERVAAVHAAGAGVLAWTVNEAPRCAELFSLGVDAITTDAIDRIAP
jgi:glycerophosphoryl diester phosphodiesterase